MSRVFVAGLCLVAGILCSIGALHAAEKDPSNAMRIVRLAIADGNVVGPDVRTASGIGWIRVAQGETVELNWTTDEHVSLHLHGYDMALRLPKGSKSKMRVRAKNAGRFPIAIKTLVSEVEKDAQQGKADQPSKNRMLFYLEVRPRQTASQ